MFCHRCVATAALLCIVLPISHIYAQSFEHTITRYNNGATNSARFATEIITSFRKSAEPRQLIGHFNQASTAINTPAGRRQAYLQLAEFFELFGDFATAINLYQTLIAQSPPQYNNATIYIRLASLLFMNNQPREAQQAVSMAFNSATNTDELHLALIVGARIDGYAADTSAAITKLQQFIDDNENSAHLRIAYSALHELRLISDDSHGAAQTRQDLRRRFPRSIEASIASTNDTSERIIATPPPAIVDIAHGSHAGSHTHNSSRTPASTNAAHHSAPSDNRPTPAPPTNQVVRLQAGAFQNHAYARALQQKIEALGLHSDIMTRNDTHKVIVRIAPADRQAVESQLATIDVKPFALR